MPPSAMLPSNARQLVFTSSQAARYLGVSLATIRRWTDSAFGAPLTAELPPELLYERARIVGLGTFDIDDPEFRVDMLHTLSDSVARMNRLVAQLHAGRHDALPQVIEPDMIIANLAQELSTVGTPIETQLGARACRVSINGDQFRAVLSHLINNAREATQSTATVVVASRSTGDRITIDVVDSGPGMDDEFIRNELFRPFHSTKSGGLGIGAYQTRELLRMAGGELEVISEKGSGTIMRMTFPLHIGAQLASSAA